MILSFRPRKWALVAALLLSAAPANAGETFQDTQLPPFTVGVCTHFRDRHQGGLQDQAMSMMKRAGIQSSRDEAAWGSCEREKGKLVLPEFYDRYATGMKTFGLEPLNILLYANSHYDNGGYPRSAEAVAGYVRYCEFMVKTLADRCRLYQVWNEWDGGCGMAQQYKRTGDPESYVRLLSAAYPAIKKANPRAVVISNSVCTGDEYLKKTLDLGLLNHCDIVSLHTYNYSKSGRNTPEDWVARMTGVDAMLRQYSGGKEVPLFVTEMGWPTQINSNGTTPERSGSYLARLYLLARTLPYIKGIWWYDYEDDGRKSAYNENNFGMLQHLDLTPKPSYFALTGVSGLVTGADFVKRLDVGDPQIWALQFKYRNGRDAIAVWSAAPDDRWQITFENASDTPAPTTLCRVGSPTLERLWQTRLPDEPGKQGRFLPVTVEDRPWILEGDLSKVTIHGTVKKFEYPERRRPASAMLFLPEAVAVAAPYQAAAPEVEIGQPGVVSFGKAANYRMIAEGERYQPNSLDAAMRLSYEAQALHVEVTVRDDVFSQTYRGGELWMGDGIQLACKYIQDRSGDGSPFIEVDVALEDGQPKVYRRKNADDSALEEFPGAKAKIVRQGDQTRYAITLPAQGLGIPQLQAGTIIGFSLLVNDNDGTQRKGYLHWGDGIGHSKDPLLYNLVMMGE